MAQIEVNNLCKYYKRRIAREGKSGFIRGFFNPSWQTVQAVDGINFEINEGEIIGYVGPNGSGKSTTVKMLSGILTPTSGSITVFGRHPALNRVRNNAEIGVVFGQRSLLWWDVPVIESFNLLRVLYNVPQKSFEENLAMLTEALGLRDLLPVPERQLSLGQKMRCNIAAALLHEPKIVFLDEPTVGIDSSTKSAIRGLIRRMNSQRKTTFIVTSHDFQDIEALCQRIIVINRGRIIVDTSVDKIRKLYGNTKTIQFDLDGNGDQLIPVLKLDGISNVSSEDNTLTFEFETAKHKAPELIGLISQSVSIADIFIREPSIEVIIDRILQGDVEL